MNLSFSDIISSFVQSFIPLFVAIDALGIIPVFLNLTQGIGHDARRRIITHATVAAAIVSVAFLFLGRIIFSLLGINENDFRIAGGIVLLIISIADLGFSGYRTRANQSDEIGIVPIGIPLMIGPAALTTMLILADQHGVTITLAALLTNIGITWFLFRHADTLLKILGDAGAKAFGKIMALLLAAIAVMMIRVALTNIIGG